jgi:hypothetical protein
VHLSLNAFRKLVRQKIVHVGQSDATDDSLDRNTRRKLNLLKYFQGDFKSLHGRIRRDHLHWETGILPFPSLVSTRGPVPAPTHFGAVVERRHVHLGPCKCGLRTGSRSSNRILVRRNR